MAMVMKDIGGESLDRLIKHSPLSLAQFLELAIGLADALETLHRQRTIHKDIRPAHIIYNSRTGAFWLTGSSPAAEDQHLPAAATQAEDLAYVSPEQTGRMNRAVDYRTDLYSLGVTFYELLTGRRPFTAEDALGMAHCHIAMTPAAPHELNAAIPEVISEIVLKLMAKAPEDRYQSSLALKADLQQCAQELAKHGTIPRFEPGLADIVGRLYAPRKLYGREQDVARLEETFNRTNSGYCELMLISGAAGLGKTALAREVQSEVLEKQGYFVEGKFDQLEHNAPYSAWLQAFDDLTDRLLTESETELVERKQNILDAVRHNGRVLTNILPKLELLIGPQPPVPELTGAAAQNRFNFLFLEFTRAVAATEHPIVVFLDDLQWIDNASLRLLHFLLTSSDILNLLIIGAFRSNEVGDDHPLTRTLKELQQTRALVEHIELSPLSKDDANRWLADCFRRPRDDIRAFADLLWNRTSGNPFFMIQLFRCLEEEGSLSFDRDWRQWKWDPKAVERSAITGSVSDLMSYRLSRLPSPTLCVLQQAACLGARFDLATLSAASGKPDDEALAALQPAINERLILVNNHQGFRFAHDRIQQAAYALIPAENRTAMHWRTGCLLRDREAGAPGDTNSGPQDQRLFAIVDQLNIGAGDFASSAEKIEIATLNLHAGEKARTRAAFAAALKYFETGLRLLGDKSWNDYYQLTLALRREAAEAVSICGNYQRMNELAADIHAHAAGILDEVPVYETEIRALTAQGRLLPAIRLGLSVLDRLGMPLPENPSQEEVTERLNQALALLQEQTIENLSGLPPMTDPAQLACASVLSQLGEPAYAASPQFFLVWASMMAETSLRHGNCALSPFAYAAYALALCATGVHVKTGSRLARAAIAMLEPMGAQSLRCRLLNIHGCTIQPWTEHIRDTLPTLSEAIDSAPESGDFTSGGYAAFNICTAAFFMGEPLDQLAPRIRANLDVIADMRQTYIWNWVAFHYVAVQRLRGAKADGQIPFDEENWLASAKAANDECGLAYYFLSKLTATVLLGEAHCGEAMALLAEMNAHQAGFQGAFAVPVSCFYSSLALLKFGMEDAPSALEKIRANWSRLQSLAQLAPMNFQHKCDLISAELARVEGKKWEAAWLYETAVAGARKHGFVQEEAIACELASAFYSECGMETAALLHRRGACEGYARWQAWAKVRALSPGGFPDQPSTPVEASPSSGVGTDTLDLSTVMKATHAISREMDLKRLLDEVMRVVIENAGAQRGVLLLPDEGAWRVAAKSYVGAAEKRDVGAAGEEISSLADVRKSGEAPIGVIRFVARTKERVLLEDAAHQGKFAGDQYIRRRRTRSLLCAPLLSHGELIGILYLENDLAAGAFTPEKVQLLELILSQAAISLENARIFKALRESEARYRRFLDIASEGIWMLGPDGRTIFVNARLTEIFGHSAEKMIGSLVTDFMFEEDMADHLEKFGERRKGQSGRYERRFRHKDGHTLWTIISSSPVFDEKGHFQGAFGMITDITERKQAEAEILQLNRELEERVAQRTASLEMANKELESFSYSVSHDLRAPLRAIDGFSRILLEDYANTLDADGQRYLGLVRQGAAKMGQLIDDILAFSRMSRAELALKPVDMTSLAREVYAELLSGASERNIQFSLNELPAARCDPTMMRQVMANLLGNAIKYTGGKPEAIIEMSATASDKEMTYCIKDNGAGFDMAGAGKLFGAFQRLHSSQEFEGTSVGLAIVKHIIERHGGKVWAEGKAGEGATFYFSLPRSLSIKNPTTRRS